MKRMKWIPVLMGAALAAALALKAAPVLPVETAQAHLKKGAMLLDVRTAGEFQSSHLTNAVNIPLDQLKATVPQCMPDKSQVLLLYCRSGRRSGIAEQELRSLGYTNTFNLGSFERAGDIVNGKAP
jgi:phage shock protein E